MFAKEAKRQSLLSGHSFDIGRRHRQGRLSEHWDVIGHFLGQEVHNDYVFLRWDDLIRQQWTRRLPAIVAEAFSTLRGYARSGVLRRIYQTRRVIFQTLVYTSVLITGLALAALGLGALVAWAAFVGLGWTLWVALAGGLATMLAVLFTWPLIEKSLNPLWASRATAFILAQSHSRVAGLDDKLAAFAEQIVAAAQAAEHDEIMLVAHSSGVQLAVSTMALALKKYPKLGQQDRQGVPVSLLTLGGSIPLLAMLPQAQFFRDRLQVLLDAEQIFWVDVNQTTDWVCWAAPGPRPLPRSPRIHTLFSEKNYQALKRDQLRLHFQYLMAGELAGDYDFFAITCGPASLAASFSPSLSPSLPDSAAPHA